MLKKFFCPPCLIGLVLILAVFGGYFLLRGGYQAPVPTIPPTVTPSPEGEGVEIKEITVSGTEFSFSPASITVSSGEKVKLTFRNDGGAPHNLIVEGLGIATRTISGGQSDTIEFTVPASGTYTFFCLVSGHRAAGMEGSLIVE